MGGHLPFPVFLCMKTNRCPAGDFKYNCKKAPSLQLANEPALPETTYSMHEGKTCPVQIRCASMNARHTIGARLPQLYIYRRRSLTVTS